MADDKKKSIFDNLINALTDREEKEAAAKAAAEKAAAELAAKEAEARKAAAEDKRDELVAKVATEREAKEKAVKEAAEQANREAARKNAEAEAAIRVRAEEQRKRLAEEASKRAEEAAKPKFIAEHKVSPDETLSHLALKYYGHATRDYWMLIYEANKETIGGNPNIVRVGTVINIPELPEELK